MCTKKVLVECWWNCHLLPESCQYHRPRFLLSLRQQRFHSRAAMTQYLNYTLMHYWDQFGCSDDNTSAWFRKLFAGKELDSLISKFLSLWSKPIFWIVQAYLQPHLDRCKAPSHFCCLWSLPNLRFQNTYLFVFIPLLFFSSFRMWLKIVINNEFFEAWIWPGIFISPLLQLYWLYFIYWDHGMTSNNSN